jgi:outer membrane protein insertion porin family
MRRGLFAAAAVAVASLLCGESVHAQQPPSPNPPGSAPEQAQTPSDLPVATVCGQQARPAAQPPAGSSPVVLFIAPCFEAQGNASVIEPQTYVYYIQQKASVPSRGVWVPYDAAAEKTITEDFRRLWDTKFLDNLFIDVTDYPFPNGVVGKIVVYHMEERQRVKVVDYVGSKKIETAKIDEKLKDANAQIRLDTFIDPGLVRKVQGIVQDMLREKGFQFASVTPDIQEIPGGPKLVHLTFHMDEGPKVEIRRIDFLGNKAFPDSELKGQLKDTKDNAGFQDFGHLWTWIVSTMADRSYKETKFDEDAEKLVAFYREHGYIKANVGVPELKVVSDSTDKKTRYIELKIPVTEGDRYKVGSFEVAGNTVVKTDYLKPLFKTEPGEFYSEKKIRKGMEKAREVYGTGGYFEFTGFPDYKFRDDPNPNDPAAPAALAAPDAPSEKKPAVVDVTMRMVEGQQFFVNRITFTGNTTTHDNVIRREMRLVEDGVFNTEALKFSVKRLNQLGYFKALEGGKDVDVQKTPGATNKVDVKLKLEEQNRNQLTFGAGVSEYEGVFGQLSFQTANFLGRGESLTVSVQSGSRAQTYSVGFTEPFMFDRNMTLGAQVFRTDVRYIGQYTQKTRGGVLTLGWPLGRGFTRMFTNYSYQRVRVTEVNAIYNNPLLLARNPFLRDSLLQGVGQNGERIISKVTPSIVYNTVDQPIFPTSGKRFSASVDLAGLGGNTNFYKPMLEGIWYLKQNNRMVFGMRAQAEYIRQFTGRAELPIFEKLFLGGEYSVRGFDIRTIGPADVATPYLIVGGNKSLLFNFEEQFTIAGPVRAILFYDAGQVQAGPMVQSSPFVDLGGYNVYDVPGKPFAWDDFKTSTGVEVRFFMPVLNVPFRLIFAFNPQRSGVYNNQLQPQKAFQFRFAVGSTF